MSSNRLIPFGIFTALIGPSILCYLFIFIQSIRKRILHKHIRNQIILVVLIFSFLQVKCFS